MAREAISPKGQLSAGESFWPAGLSESSERSSVVNAVPPPAVQSVSTSLPLCNALASGMNPTGRNARHANAAIVSHSRSCRPTEDGREDARLENMDEMLAQVDARAP
jgi:hypothetical protein